MRSYQKRTIYISIAALAFFLLLSLITRQMGFFLWSLLPVFMVLMLTFAGGKNADKKNRG